MTMIAKMTRRFFGSGLGPHMFQDWCEQEGQKYAAQTLMSVPGTLRSYADKGKAGPHSRAGFAREWAEECLCHTSQIAISPAIKAGHSAANGKSWKRVGIPRSARDGGR